MRYSCLVLYCRRKSRREITLSPAESTSGSGMHGLSMSHLVLAAEGGFFFLQTVPRIRDDCFITVTDEKTVRDD